MNTPRRAEILSWLPDWETSGSASSREIARAFRELLAEVAMVRKSERVRCAQAARMVADQYLVSARKMSGWHEHLVAADRNRASGARAAADAIEELLEPPA